MNTRSKRGLAVAAVVLCTTAVLLLFSLLPKPAPGARLLLQDGDYGTIYAAYALAEGDSFSVSFLHSVNQTKVEETYQIQHGTIILTSCLYYGFGAGVATEVEPGQSLSYTEDGGMLLSGLNRPIPHLSYIVGTVSDHILSVGGTAVSLRTLCGRNTTVRFLYQPAG